MFNATLKRSLIILLIATMAGLSGCSNPEEKRADRLDEALELSQTGAHEAALSILEALAQQYPNDPEILQSMGRVYAGQGDHTMAAFFLEQAYLQKPDDIELLYQTYQSQEAAGQPSGETLEKLAARSPKTLTKDLWIKLGAHRVDKNRTEAALEAYLKGVDPENEAPAPETAAAIGQLFAKLGNYAQAADWLEIAADNDDPTALTALFGLLQIQLSQKNWSEAEATIERLNKQFPGAVDASRWKQASDDLKRWRAAQEKMKAQLAAEEAAKKERAEKEAAEVADGEGSGAEGGEGNTTEVADAAQNGEGSGKSQIISDLETAEALANRPAQEVATEGGEASVDPDAPAVVTTGDETTVAFNPEITIAPADPDWSIDVDYDEASQSPDTNFRIEPDTDTNAPMLVEATEEATPAVTPPEVVSLEPPKTLEELLVEAEKAEIDRNYKKAIQKYWAAIGVNNSRAEVWNLLSRAYLLDGQLQNADTAALESVRLAPKEVAYTLDFLRVAQRSRPPKEFLAQLETAYDRFPSSPEITLSLARAHERISKDKFVARNLYLRFVDIAPNHPLRSEAEAAVARLR